MGIPHFLAIPYPVLGHVNPLMQLSQILTQHGCKVTFLHTEFNHKRANNVDNNLKESEIKYVTLPDGLDPEDDRSEFKKLLLSIKRTMPPLIPKLIEDVNALDVDNKITCIVVTFSMGWVLEIGKKMGIKGALLFPASATSLAYIVSIPKLLEDGVIDSEGHSTKKQEIQLSPNMPMVDTTTIPWQGLDKIFFDNIMQEIQAINYGDWWLCNTTHDLEPGLSSISSKFLPIGPLKENDDNKKSSFWQEDTTCLDWLDQQPPQSVVYVSFGSLATIDSNQFKELALGLDLMNNPFLWVVRPSNDNKVNYEYPNEFYGSKGKIITWAPQRKILNHPSIACFVSHCGWNSTLEGIHAGVPFLCWPFFSDQFLDKSYICDVWKIGLGLSKDESGLISRDEIKKKVVQLLGDKDIKARSFFFDIIKARSLKMKKMTTNNIGEGGQSSKNLQKFIHWAN